MKGADFFIRHTNVSSMEEREKGVGVVQVFRGRNLFDDFHLKNLK